ncbi:hypothetical protein A2382_04140 [Candidatus Woesebacteria bacterium RIFOXYB1_FULL_38_16]|uniref:PD-(D/E)XK endonuclease-like domain-containing protein n=1 Tax=Candidatus Woesebacteria bacterium RIFOXYB1_FULL_38_16 TaxID=1802538 RepID=A0A1F8CSB5_9BACT|nr:MAG: hypothetical protein A2382_04140 [Candidatus Woesebacteria bacterium RIFOXYB1_FULL_38_16]
MIADKYKATWVSHSSMGDFLKCPRLYYLRSIYKNPVTKNKMTIMEPALALGQVVHEVIEPLSLLPTKERNLSQLLDNFEISWKGVSGEKGGFKDTKHEEDYKERGKAMLNRVIEHPGPILNKAIKVRSEDLLPPRYLFSKEDNIILCGKIDWLEYLPESDSIHIIDFKTGKWEEKDESLQLPIYHLLASNLQKRPITKISYWYLDRNNEPSGVKLPELSDSYDRVYTVAKRVKLARQLDHFICPKQGCRYCWPYEEILKGKGKVVGKSDYQDIYIL